MKHDSHPMPSHWQVNITIFLLLGAFTYAMLSNIDDDVESLLANNDNLLMLVVVNIQI
jgi:hypothetical protein